MESLKPTKTGGSRFKAPKTDRVITLPAFAIAELKHLKQEQAEELLKLGIRQSGERWFVAARMAGLCNRKASPTNSLGW